METSDKNLPPPESKYSRRDFLKLTGAVAVTAGVAILGGRGISEVISAFARKKSERKESLLSPEIMVAALSVPGEGSRGQSVETGYSVLQQIDKILKSQPVTLVVTPEYSFEMYNKEKPEKLMLKKVDNGEFVVHDESSEIVRDILSRSQQLALTHRCDIFLATFHEIGLDDGEYYGTLLHLDPQGKIVGRKRKFHSPEGSFMVKVGPKELKVLSLICGEAWEEIQDSFAIPPEWVGKNSPYDMMTHSIAQGDLNFNMLAGLVQKTIPEGELEPARREWMRDCFDKYYRNYRPYLKPNAPIIVADWSVSGVFNPDLSPIKKYEGQPRYTVAKISYSGEFLK